MKRFNISKEEENSKYENNNDYKKLEEFEKDIEKRKKRKRILIYLFLVIIALVILTLVVILSLKKISSSEIDNKTDDCDKYSFGLLYYSNYDNEEISIINPSFINKICNMTIDGNVITPSSKYLLNIKEIIQLIFILSKKN